MIPRGQKDSRKVGNGWVLQSALLTGNFRTDATAEPFMRWLAPQPFTNRTTSPLPVLPDFHFCPVRLASFAISPHPLASLCSWAACGGALGLVLVRLRAMPL